MLSNFQCRGALLVFIMVGQEPTVLAEGAGGAIWTCPIMYLFFLPFTGRRLDVD